MHQGLFQQQMCDSLLPLSVAELERRGITRGVRQGPKWKRTTRGYDVPAHRTTSTAQRIVDRLPALSPGGAVGGWAAAFVQGVDWLDGRSLEGRVMSVPLCVGPEVRRCSTVGCRYARDRLSQPDVVTRHGVPVTEPVRTAFDTVRWADDVTEAVVALDALGHFGLVGLSTLTHDAARFPRPVGGRQVHEALRWVDIDIRSPWESRLRMVYVLEAGLPRPLVNPTVFDAQGRFVGVPDLLDIDAGLVMEYDGSGHRERRQHNEDNAREEALESVGLIVVRADSHDYRHQRAPGLATTRRTATWSGPQSSPGPLDVEPTQLGAPSVRFTH